MAAGSGGTGRRKPGRPTKKLYGRVWVRCRTCKKSGVTNLSQVGRVKWIDKCGACLRTGG